MTAKNLAKILILFSVAALAPAFAQTTPTWDTSGNGLLKGTYYFRQVYYFLSSSANGTLADAASTYGTITFSGTGTYTITARALTLVDASAGQVQTTVSRSPARTPLPLPDTVSCLIRSPRATSFTAW